MKKGVLYFVLMLAALLVAGPVSNSNAATAATGGGSIVGFEFGVGYLVPSETRFKGSSNNFTLVFPVDRGLTLGIFHESVSLSGKDGAATGTVLIDINELRISKEVRDKASVFIGIGSAQTTGAIVTTGTIADIGVKYSALESMGRVFKTDLSVDLMYRMLTIPATTPAGWGSAVDDLGGFGLGVNIAILF